MAETKTPQKTENVREDYNLPKTKLKIVMPDVKPPKDAKPEEDGKSNGNSKN